MERLKAFIPACAKEYKDGSGELCFFLVSEELKAAYEKEATGGNYTGILDEQPFNYDELKPGQELPLKLQGIDAPIVPIEALKPWQSFYEKLNILTEDLTEGQTD